MILVMAVCSGRATMILCNPQNHQIIAKQNIDHADAHGLSTQLQQGLNTMLNEVHKSVNDLSQIWGVNGPGAFTGLRMCGSFLMGLGRALNKPVWGIPSYDLFAKDFFYPLRHDLAKTLDLQGALQRKIDFLKVSGSENCVQQIPTQNDFIVGLMDHPFWPDAEQLKKGMLAQKQNPQPLKIFYGLDPKIFGVRQDPIKI